MGKSFVFYLLHFTFISAEIYDFIDVIETSLECLAATVYSIVGVGHHDLITLIY